MQGRLGGVVVAVDAAAVEELRGEDKGMQTPIEKCVDKLLAVAVVVETVAADHGVSEGSVDAHDPAVAGTVADAAAASAGMTLAVVDDELVRC